MNADTMTKAESAAGASEFAHMLLKVSDVARSQRDYLEWILKQTDMRPEVTFTARHHLKLRTGCLTRLLWELRGSKANL